MFKRKPINKFLYKFLKSGTPQNAENKINSVEEDYKIVSISEEIANYKNEKPEGYTVEEILHEYRYMNDIFVEVMDRLLYIFVNYEFVNDDISYLKSVKYYYFKRKIADEVSGLYLNDIHNNILHATLRETVRKARFFFGDTYEEWEDLANKYRSDALKFSDKYFSLLIGHVDKLYFYLKELFRDFYGESNILSDFSITSVIKGIQGLTLEEQRIFVTRKMAEFKELCLKDDYYNIDEEYEEEFLQKCQKLIDIIDFQRQNGISINPTYEEIEKWQNNFEDRDKPKDTLPETDITLNRQFLALYYMLNELDSKIFSRNKSEIARFIQLLTGKNYDNIYKLTKNPIKDPSNRTSAKYQFDIQFIKEAFIKLGLDNIVRKIENDNLVG